MSGNNELTKSLIEIGLAAVVHDWSQYSQHEELFRQIVHAELENRRMQRFNYLHKQSRLTRFRPMTEFDWSWPTKINRGIIEEALELRFLESRGNLIIIGPNGVGKTMIAKNIAWESIRRGRTALFINAGKLLNELAACNENSQLESKLRRYSRIEVLVLDELGYISYAARHADLLFQLIDRRHETSSTIITTNKIFGEWNTTFPNSACVGAMIDRLIQDGDVVQIEGDSYRLKIAQNRQKSRKVPKDEKRK
jgi:DNA replication protein DnaC